jgi:hypothetical protein
MDVETVPNPLTGLTDIFYTDNTCIGTPFAIQFFYGGCFTPSGGINDFFQLSLNVSGNAEVNFYDQANGGCTGTPRKSVKTYLAALAPGGMFPIALPISNTFGACTQYVPVPGVYYTTSNTKALVSVPSPNRQF